MLNAESKATLRLTTLTTLAELRGAADRWDDLWRRSDVSLPTLRAELVAQWFEHFAPEALLRVLVVEDQERWLAVLPLFGSTCRGIPCGVMPENEWSCSGDLLWDANAGDAATMDVLVAGLRTLPWPVVRLRPALIEEARWQALTEALARSRTAYDYRDVYAIPLIPIDHDWEACCNRWSRNHRCHIHRVARHFTEDGDFRFELRCDLRPDEVGPWLEQVFAVENLSWKAAAGTSVLHQRGLFEFYLRQARQCAAWGQLEIAYLERQGRPAASIYSLFGKGTSHWLKTGYNPEFHALSPGQLIKFFVLKQFQDRPDRTQIDCRGPLTDAVAKWRPRTYHMGRLAVACGPLLGTAVVGLSKAWHRVRRRNAEAGWKQL